MNTQEIIDKSQKLSGVIFDKMNVVENCSNAVADIADLEIGAVNKDGQILTFKKVLTEKQMDDVKNVVVGLITANMSEAATWLDNLTKVGDADCSEGAEEPKKTTKKTTTRKTTVRKKTTKKAAEEEKQLVEIDETKLAEMYVKEDKTVKEIADAFGTDKETVHAKITELGLKKPTGMDAAEEAGWKKRVMSRFMAQY